MSLENIAEADTFVSQTGGLPEITAAAADFQSAIDRTRAEIASAEIADRFPRKPSDNFLVSIGAHSERPQVVLSHQAREGVRLEGEAGYKRVQLLAELDRIEGDFVSLIGQLVLLRTDLAVSQQDM